MPNRNLLQRHVAWGGRGEADVLSHRLISGDDGVCNILRKNEKTAFLAERFQNINSPGGFLFCFINYFLD